MIRLRTFLQSGALALLLWPLSAQLALAQSTIIDTNFSSVSVNAAAVPSPSSPDALPLRAPTRITAQEPTSVTTGTSEIGGLKPPYALLKIAELADRPEVTAAAVLSWDLKQLPLEPGRYRLSLQVAVLNPEGSPGRVRIILLTESGKPMEGHAPSVPPVISLNGGRVYADRTAQPVPLQPGEVYQLELTLDTQQLTWGAKANGITLREEAPFPEDYLSQLQNGLQIGSVEYQVIGGMGDKPGAEVAIGNVVFQKL